MDIPPPPRFTTPLLHTLSTPDLTRLLASSGFPSLSSFLTPFAASPSQSPCLNNVQVRTPPNHEPRQIPHFPIEFRERPLPKGWNDPSTTTSLSPLSAANTSLAMRRDSSTGISMSQSQRDELFLDQISSTISTNLDSNYLSPHPPPEIHLDPTRLQRKKLQYDLEGNLLEQDEDKVQEWETKKLDDLTPWYTEFRKHVFERREVVEYETWGWPVGCILALSTNHPDPLNALSQLWDLTSPSQLYSPSNNPSSSSSSPTQQDYINPDILRYILIIHDLRTDDPTTPRTSGGGGSGTVSDWDQVRKLEETVKKTYGVHTKVLPLYDHYKEMKLPGEGREEEEEGVGLERELEKLWPSTSEGGKNSSSTMGMGTGQGELVGLGYEEEGETTVLSLSTSISKLDSLQQTRRGGHDLSLKDLQTLSLWIRELVSQSIIPHLERTITVSNEQFNNSKKSIGGRLFSVGRKYFGGGGGGGGGSGTSSTGGSTPNGISRTGSPVTLQLGYNAQRGYYPYQSQESQSRRLGDLAFMLRDYKLAQGVYGEVSKDFKNDKAWKHYSSALRMQGLCQLLLASTTTPPLNPNFLTGPNSPDSLLLTSILPPSPTAPSSIDFDLLRSTMLYHHLYESTPLSSSTSTVASSRMSSTSLMRLVDLSIERAAGGSGDEDELWVAMVCEQSALSQLGVTNTNTNTNETTTTTGTGGRRERKFVLEMCLAGIRYEKCGLKSLSRRCLSQASSLYSPSSSSPTSTLATTRTCHEKTTFEAIKTHLHHSLARQAYNASQPLDSITHYLQLLSTRPPSTTSSDPSAAFDGDGEEGVNASIGEEVALDWLDDFSLAWELLGTGGGGGQARAEELARDAGLKELPVRLFESGNVNVTRRVGGGGSDDGEVGGEKEWEELEKLMGEGGNAKASLKGKMHENQALLGETFYLELPITNPLEAFLSIGDLTVQVEGQGESRGTLQIDQSLDGEIVELAPTESRVIYIPIRGSTIGIYNFVSLSYRFHNLLPVTESLSTTTKARATLVSAKIATTTPSVSFPNVELRQPIPVLSISTDNLPERLFHGQQSRNARLTLKNTGQVGLKGLRGICSDPELCFFARPSTDNNGVSAEDGKIESGNEISKNRSTALLGDGEELGPGGELEVEVSMRGDQVGEKDIRWLFNYESSSTDGGSKETFSVRAVHKFEVSPSLEFRYATRPSSRAQHPFMLNLEAYNSGVPTEDLRVSSLSLVSPLWRVSLDPGGQSTQDLFSTPIPWQQISNLALAIDQVEHGLEQCKRSIEWSVRQVESLLQGKKIEGDEPGRVELSATSVALESPPSLAAGSALFKSLVNSHSRFREQSLSTDFPTVPPHLLRSLFPLFAATSSLILIGYSAPSLDLTGYHVLPLPSLGASQNYLRGVLTTAELKAGGLYAESQRERSSLIKSLRRSELGNEQDPASVFIHVEPLREHDFEQGPCSMPVNFMIRNLSPTTPFDYTLTLGTSSSSALVYTGILTRRGSIAPLSVARISARAFITREGVYDVGGWSLHVRTEGRNWTRAGDKREVRIKAREVVVAPIEAGTGCLVDVSA